MINLGILGFTSNDIAGIGRDDVSTLNQSNLFLSMLPMPVTVSLKWCYSKQEWCQILVILLVVIILSLFGEIMAKFLKRCGDASL